MRESVPWAMLHDVSEYFRWRGQQRRRAGDASVVVGQRFVRYSTQVCGYHR